MEKTYKPEVQEFLKQVDVGMNGGVPWIPIGFPKMGMHMGIGQKIYYLIGGASGTGKTAFVDLSFVLFPYAWWKNRKEREETDLEVRWIYRSMERSKTYKIAKWVTHRLYMKYKILLSVPDILGWGSRKNHVSQEIYEKIKESMDYFEEMFEYVEIIDGPIHPTAIFKHVEDYALNHGKVVKEFYKTIDKIERYTKVYKPNNPKLITIIIEDTVNKLRGEKTEGVYLPPHSKMLLDKMSDYNGMIFRDFYGFSPLAISQFNRAIEDTQRRVKTDMSPLPGDFKGSGNMYDDADVTLALYNPYKLKDMTHMEYDIENFVSNTGYNRFRACHILKNSYGIDDASFGMNFIGECGHMSELPKANEMTKEDYEQYKNPKRI